MTLDLISLYINKWSKTHFDFGIPFGGFNI